MQPYKITPTLLPLAGLIVGIYIQKSFIFSNFQIKFITGCIIIFLVIVFLVTKKLKNKIKKVYTSIFIFLLSFEIGILSLCIYQNKIIQAHQNIINKNLNLEGIVTNKSNHTLPQIKEIIKLHIIRLKKENESTYKNISFDTILYLKEKSNLEIDDEIYLKNIYFSIPQNTNIAGNQSFQDYLLKEKISGTSFIQNLSYQLLYRPKFSLKKWVYQKRTSLLESIKKKLSWPARSLYYCIFLGNKKQSSTYLKNSRHLFNYWGISHYLARSGIHVILLILIWKIFLSFLPIPFYFKHIILLIFCSIYIALSWSSISFIRAIFIFIAYEIGKLLNKQSNLLHLLSLTCFIILLFNPFQLFFLDFQLSFALTFALAYLMKSTKEKTP